MRIKGLNWWDRERQFMCNCIYIYVCVCCSAGHVEAGCWLMSGGEEEEKKKHVCRGTHKLLEGLHYVGTWPSALQLLTATERTYRMGCDRIIQDRKTVNHLLLWLYSIIKNHCQPTIFLLYRCCSFPHSFCFALSHTHLLYTELTPSPKDPDFYSQLVRACIFFNHRLAHWQDRNALSCC